MPAEPQKEKEPETGVAGGHLVLEWVLESEGRAFQRIHQNWRPKDLIPQVYLHKLLSDLQARYKILATATDEMATLDRADIYLKLFRRMGIWLRRANFARRSDHMTFIQSVAGFYSDFGEILRRLKIDSLRGKL